MEGEASIDTLADTLPETEAKSISKTLVDMRLTH